MKIQVHPQYLSDRINKTQISKIVVKPHSWFIIIYIIFNVVGCNAGVPDQLVLFDFETEADLNRINWQCFVLFSISDEFATHGSKSLKMDLYPSIFPGFNPMLSVTDWRGFGSLELDLINPSEKNLFLSLKIDDLPGPPQSAERFIRELTIRPGINRVSIAMDELVASGSGRKLNLKDIQKLFLVRENLRECMTLYIDNIRLIGKNAATTVFLDRDL